MLRQAIAAQRLVPRSATISRASSIRLQPTVAHTSFQAAAAQLAHAKGLPSSLRQASFLPWRRQASKRPALPVYFRRPRRWPTGQQVRRRIGYFVIAGFIYYMCYQVWASVVLDPLLDWFDELEQKLTEEERREMMEEMEDDDEPIYFLPFPFGLQSVKAPPYKGSDPEWDMFVKVNRDKNLQKEIKQELLNIVHRSAVKNKQLMGVFGNEPKVKQYWLDILYPRTPPPQYFMTGLAFFEDGIYWAERPVDPVAARQIESAIYPKAAVLTAWSFVSTLVTQAAQDVAGTLGFGSTEAREVTWSSVTMDRIKGGFGTTSDQIANGSGQSEKPPSLQLPDRTGTGVGATPAGGELNPDNLLDALHNDSRIMAARRAASVTFAKNWKPKTSPPTRGCIRVDGMVEIQGKKAVLSLYVLGWYDPIKKKYVTVQANVKHLVSLRQRPAN